MYRRRILAIVLFAAMIFSSLAGCTKKENPATQTDNTTTVENGVELIKGNIYATGDKILKEKKTYKIVVTKDPNSQNSFNDKQVIKDTEALTNVHIDWQDVPVAAWKEQVNIMIAAGNLPDGFCGADVDVMQNIDMFTPLGDIVQKYAPHVVEMFEGDPALKKAITAPDGKIYSLPTNKANPSNLVNNMLWMNPDWLKKVGKEIPKTTEDFVDVLRAFKTGDPNGNGKADEIPFVSWESTDESANLHSIIGAFGVVLPTEYVYSKDGQKVVFGGTEPGLKPALNWLHTLYSEGLLDREVFTMDNAQINAKAQSKDVIIGAITYWIPDSMDTKFADYIVLDPLKGPNGDQIWTQGYDPLGATIQGFTVTKACKDPEVLVRYYDMAMKDMETIMNWQWGPKGAGLWKPVGTDQWTQTQDFVPQGTNLTFFKRTIAPSIYSPNFLWKKYAEKEVADPRNAKKREAAQRILPYAVHMMPRALYDPEKVTARNLLFTDIDNYMKKFFANGVVNGVTDAQWEEHLATCKKLKTDEYTAMWQEYYDAKK